MPIQYLVPCSCGRKMPVETRQAGEVISCACGASLDIPRLIELKKLEKIAIQAADAKPHGIWGVGQGLILSGAVLLIGVVLLSILVIIFGAGDPYDNMTPDQIRTAFQQMTPEQTWGTWMNLRQSGINPPKKAVERYLEGLHAQRQMLLAFLSIAAVVDVALLVAGILVARRSRVKHTTPPSNIV